MVNKTTFQKLSRAKAKSRIPGTVLAFRLLCENGALEHQGVSFLGIPILETEPSLAQSETPFFGTQPVGRELNNHLRARCDRRPGRGLRQAASDGLGIRVVNYVDCFTQRQEIESGWEPPWEGPVGPSPWCAPRSAAWETRGALASS